MISRPVAIVALWLAIAATPALAATEDGSPEAMQKQFEAMQQTMGKMHATKNASELNTLMQQHMAQMMSGMQMMHGMMGSGMMGGQSGTTMGGQSGSMMGSQSGSMMGGQSGSMMGRQSGGMMGGQSSGSATQGQQADSMANMQQRMSMMWMMMNQMMQHMQEQQRLDQPKQ